ncbi:MAG: glycosyltransferase family 39 protein [Chloroflexi bacterium]|nr:glycosyltransferase family 39 protein [Chloroflexota bacterium]
MSAQATARPRPGMQVKARGSGSAPEPSAARGRLACGTGEALALALIILGGAALRAYRLGAADLWLDEANTVHIASLPIDAMLRELAADDVHPPLFYLLVKTPLAVWPSEGGLRLLPWLFGVLCIPLAFAVARDLAGRAAGLAAAALVAVSAPLVVFSQEGRMYTLLALLELLATWALVRGLEGGGRRWWIGFALASAAALYTHNQAGLFLVAHLAAALVGGWRRVRGWRLEVGSNLQPPTSNLQPPTFLVAGAIALALYAPWLPFALGQALGLGVGGGWLGPPPPLWMPAATLVNLLAGSEARDGLLSPGFAVEHLYLLGGAVALLAFGWQRLGTRPVARRVLLATGAIPIGLSLALSQVSRIYVDKTFLVDALLLAIVMAAGLPSGVPRARQVGPLAAAALLILAELWAVRVNWETPRESYRALVGDLEAQVQADDAVLAVPGFLSRPVDHYLALAGSTLAVQQVTSPDQLPDQTPTRLWVVSGGAWDESPAARAASAWREQTRYGRAWERLYPDPGLRLTLYERRG